MVKPDKSLQAYLQLHPDIQAIKREDLSDEQLKEFKRWLRRTERAKEKTPLPKPTSLSDEDVHNLKSEIEGYVADYDKFTDSHTCACENCPITYLKFAVVQDSQTWCPSQILLVFCSNKWTVPISWLIRIYSLWKHTALQGTRWDLGQGSDKAAGWKTGAAKAYTQSEVFHHTCGNKSNQDTRLRLCNFQHTNEKRQCSLKFFNLVNIYNSDETGSTVSFRALEACLTRLHTAIGEAVSKEFKVDTYCADPPEESLSKVVNVKKYVPSLPVIIPYSGPLSFGCEGTTFTKEECESVLTHANLLDACLTSIVNEKSVSGDVREDYTRLKLLMMVASQQCSMADVDAHLSAGIPTPEEEGEARSSKCSYATEYFNGASNNESTVNNSVRSVVRRMGIMIVALAANNQLPSVHEPTLATMILAQCFAKYLHLYFAKLAYVLSNRPSTIHNKLNVKPYILGAINWLKFRGRNHQSFVRHCEDVYSKIETTFTNLSKTSNRLTKKAEKAERIPDVIATNVSPRFEAVFPLYCAQRSAIFSRYRRSLNISDEMLRQFGVLVRMKLVMGTRPEQYINPEWLLNLFTCSYILSHPYPPYRLELEDPQAGTGGSKNMLSTIWTAVHAAIKNHFAYLENTRSLQNYNRSHRNKEKFCTVALAMYTEITGNTKVTGGKIEGHLYMGSIGLQEHAAFLFAKQNNKSATDSKFIETFLNMRAKHDPTSLQDTLYAFDWFVDQRNSPADVLLSHFEREDSELKSNTTRREHRKKERVYRRLCLVPNDVIQPGEKRSYLINKAFSQVAKVQALDAVRYYLKIKPGYEIPEEIENTAKLLNLVVCDLFRVYAMRHAICIKFRDVIRELPTIFSIFQGENRTWNDDDLDRAIRYIHEHTLATDNQYDTQHRFLNEYPLRLFFDFQMDLDQVKVAATALELGDLTKDIFDRCITKEFKVSKQNDTTVPQKRKRSSKNVQQKRPRIQTTTPKKWFIDFSDFSVKGEHPCGIKCTTTGNNPKTTHLRGCCIGSTLQVWGVENNKAKKIIEEEGVISKQHMCDILEKHSFCYYNKSSAHLLDELYKLKINVTGWPDHFTLKRRRR